MYLKDIIRRRKSSVEAGLREMIASGEIKRFGTGRSTYYLRSDALK